MPEDLVQLWYVHCISQPVQRLTLPRMFLICWLSFRGLFVAAPVPRLWRRFKKPTGCTQISRYVKAITLCFLLSALSLDAPRLQLADWSHDSTLCATLCYIGHCILWSPTKGLSFISTAHLCLACSLVLLVALFALTSPFREVTHHWTQSTWWWNKRDIHQMPELEHTRTPAIIF